MVLSSAVAIVLFVSIALFSYHFSKIIKLLREGKSASCLDQPFKRMRVLLEQVFLHKKLLRQPAAGLIHFIIFWGFMVLTLGTLEWILWGLSNGKMNFHFLGPYLYPFFVLSQDVFNFLVLLAVGGAFFRRLVLKPARLSDNSWASRADATFILLLIAMLVSTNLLTHSVAIHNQEDAWASFKPVASFLANTLPLSDPFYLPFWWAHLLIVLFFLNYLPFSKHLHILVAAPNVWFSKLEPRGRLSTPNLNDETITKFGVEKIQEFSWKNLLDSVACTECGRCNEYCPTADTGKALKPKTLMIEMRRALEEKCPEDLIPSIFSEQFVWDCTTCGACVEACPVMIDHVDALVEMRRALVLNRGKNPEEGSAVFRNWETTSNPWGFPESSRQEWLLERGIPKYEADHDFEYLYYIGCAGSFDDRNKKVVESVVKILQAAGVKFGILGREERCNGETARRMGNEWLAQQMIKLNLEVLQKYKVRKMITSCPHCFNTLKNEYPVFGAEFEVRHHTEVIDELIQQGRLKLKQENQAVTFHDSCYMGRYNDVYDAPRNTLVQVTGTNIIELKRNKHQGFCCGAGGGRMWLEEKTGTRINQNRAEEIIASGASTVGVACPFCITMISDGLKSKGRLDISVKDISEIVSEALM